MCGHLRLCPLLLLLLLPLGCGKHYQLAPVSGRVTMDNRPLAQAEVRFYPIGGLDFPYSVGVTDDQGNYTLHLGIDNNTEGAVVGDAARAVVDGMSDYSDIFSAFCCRRHRSRPTTY